MPIRQRVAVQAEECAHVSGAESNIPPLYLPVAHPDLSAVREVWRQAKYRLITLEFYVTQDELMAAVSEHQDLRDQGRHLQVPHAQRVRRNLYRPPV